MSRTEYRVALATLLAVLLAPRAGLLARPVQQTSPVAYTATVPDRFVTLPGVRDGVQAFADPRGGNNPVVVILRPLPSTIDHAPLSEHEAREVMASLAPGSSVRLESARTMGGTLTVPLLVAHGNEGDVMAVVTLPSWPRAIQLTVTAGLGDEALVTGVARELAASFAAPTNWLTPAQIARRRAAYALLVTAWAVLLAYGVAWFARLRKAPASRAPAAFLAASGAAFLATAALLASLPRGASAILPWMPGAMGLVLLANAAIAVRRALR